jgi:serine/threonine protein kinase
VQAVQAAACREAGGSSTQCQQQQPRQDQQQRQQGEQVLREVSCGTSSALVGSPCLLLHWCEGGSLQQRLEPSPGLHVPLSARGTWQVLRAAHTALCQAHDASILLASLTPSNVLVCKEGTPGYRDGNGYRLCGLSSALQPSGLDCVESALVDGGSSDAFAAPDRYYSVFSETWKLGVLLLACRMGQAVTPPNGSCLADVLSNEVCRGLRLEPVELQLMQLCFASLGERHPPKRLAEFTSYFDAATFDLLLDSV